MAGVEDVGEVEELGMEVAVWAAVNCDRGEGRGCGMCFRERGMGGVEGRSWRGVERDLYHAGEAPEVRKEDI